MFRPRKRKPIEKKQRSPEFYARQATRTVRSRTFWLMLVMGILLFVILFFQLYHLQIARHQEMQTRALDQQTRQTVVSAFRGTIYDRNGNVLVSNRATYNIVIINYVLANTGAPNENILKLLQMCQQLGIECQSHFPVTKTKPYEYDMQSLNTTWQNYFRMFLNNRDYDLDISASTLMRNLREAYRIPNDWDADDVYNVIAVRYELELRSVDNTGLENYMLAKDVDAESLAAGAELIVRKRLDRRINGFDFYEIRFYFFAIFVGFGSEKKLD